MIRPRNNLSDKSDSYNPRRDLDKSQLFFCLFYPDDTEYSADDCLDLIATGCVEYAYILHDKDGVKPHYHVYCKTAQALSIDSFAKHFHTRLYPFVQYALKKDKCIKYLRHLEKFNDGDGDYKYSPDEVFSNFDVSRYWEDFDTTEGIYINEFFNVALNYVDCYGSKCPLSVLFRYAQDQDEDKRYKMIGCLARRSYFFKTILEQIWAVRYENTPLDWSKLI